MATKLALTDLTSLDATAINDINANFTAIENIVDLLLSRDGSTPNTLTADVDLNSNQILNLGAPGNGSDAARLQDVTDAGLANTTTSMAATLVSVADSAGDYTATNVEGVLAEIATKTADLNTIIVDIGDWDMDADATATISHGITQTKIRAVNVLIRDDTSTNVYDFNAGNTTETTIRSIRLTSTSVVLARGTSGLFDNTSYNTATSYNRGWVVIQYID